VRTRQNKVSSCDLDSSRCWLALFWILRYATRQMPSPLTVEMDLALSDAVQRVASDPSYVEAFQRAYGETPSAASLQKALASFVRSVVSGSSAYDRHLRGDDSDFGEQRKRGEALFCKVADPKQTPKKAALFGGTDFFRVRDLARLGLGRVAHEQYRFDDARYYYYLVPHDSDNLPEALYETATTRYEAKDYDGARDSIDELKRLKLDHAYQDETYILDAYIDLATCRFPAADAKLNAFLKRYDPVRDAARQLSTDDTAIQKLVAAVRTSSDPASAGLGVSEETARSLGALVRMDAAYGRAKRRLAELDHQQSGLRRAMGDLDNASQRLASPKSLRPQSSEALGQTDLDKVERIEGQGPPLATRGPGGSERGGSGRPVLVRAILLDRCTPCSPSSRSSSLSA